MTPLVLLVGLVAVGLLLSAFVSLERRGHPEAILAVAMATILVESLLYQSQDDIPFGLFRLPFVGGSLRPPEVVFILAFVARTFVRGLPSRISAAALAWGCFLIWYGTAGVIGLITGNPFRDVLYQGESVIYIGGGFALASGVRVGRLVRPGAARWIGLLGAVTAVLLVTSYQQLSTAVPLPLAPVYALGRIGADGGSVLVSIGLAIFVVELARGRRRGVVLLACLPLLAAPVAVDQRAAAVGLAASVVVLVVATLGTTWRRRINATPTELGLALVMLISIVAVSSLFQVQSGQPPLLVDYYESTFLSVGNQQSAGTRRELWDEAGRIFLESPVLGSGLGERFQIRPVGFSRDWASGAFHNLVFDVGIRSGVVGLILFVGAMTLSVRQALRVWRGHQDPRVAALVLACGAVIGGLVAKGMVESVLEKSKLAALLGIALGLIAAADRSAGDRTGDGWRADEGGRVDDDVVRT